MKQSIEVYSSNLRLVIGKYVFDDVETLQKFDRSKRVIVKNNIDFNALPYTNN